MALFSDVITSTSVGTSTGQTLLNGGTNYTVSSLAGKLVSVAPVYAETGAVTAGESQLIQFSTQSQSIGSVQPKNIALAPSSGGLGTSVVAMIPIVRSFPFNTRIPNTNTPLSFYGQALVANTVAPRVGGTIWFDTNQPDKGSFEEFYDTSNGTTSTGTAAATVSLNSITINGGSQLDTVYAHVAPGTVTASQSYIGYLTVNSADMSPQQTLRAYVQPVAVGLAATTTPLQADASYHPESITLRNTATLSASYTQDQALTGAAKAVWGVAFKRGSYF